MQNPPESPEAPAKLWSRKKIALWFFGAGGGLFLVLAVALLAYDEKLQPYDDLKPNRTETPDARTNGYLFLRERWENLPEGNKHDEDRAKEMVKGKLIWDDTMMASLQTEREKAAADLNAAMALPEYLTPSSVGILDSDRVRYGWMTKLFRYSWIEAVARARAGDRAGAIRLLAEMHKLCVRHVEGSAGLLSLLVGISFNQLCVHLTCELLSQEGFEPEQLAAVADLWSQDLPLQEAWQAAMRSEAGLMESVINLAKKHPADLPEPLRVRFGGLLLKPNMTLNRHHEMLRGLCTIVFKPFPTLAAATAAGWGGVVDHRSKLMKYLDPNFSGSQMLQGCDSLQKILPGLRCGTLFYPRAVRVAIAMHRWRLAHPDQWPATLEELVPEYLSAVPEDPFNGLPLRWDRASRIIYSVGADWKPDVPLPPKADQSWSLKEHASPGLRLTRDPAVPGLPPGVPK